MIFFQQPWTYSSIYNSYEIQQLANARFTTGILYLKEIRKKSLIRTVWFHLKSKLSSKQLPAVLECVDVLSEVSKV